MYLIGKQDRLPLSKTDGLLLQHISPTQISEKHLVIKLTQQRIAAGTLGKLFLEDEGMYEFITILHPSESKLRFG
jgi:hypothetical protein